MSDIFIKIKLLFFKFLNKILALCLKVLGFFKFIFIDVLYWKVLFNIILFPIYKVYKKLVKDIISDTNIKFSVAGKIFAVLVSKKLIGTLIVILIFVWVIIDNLTVYSIYDKELKLNDSVFISISGGSTTIGSVIIDNVVLTKKAYAGTSSYLTQNDIESTESTDDYIISDPDEMTYFVFNNSAVVNPGIMNYSASYDPETGEITNPTNSLVTKTVYVVKSGDTLSSIAKSFGVSKDTILYENKLTENAVLKIGQKLTILPFTGVSHKITYGDTLLGLSIKYDVDVDEIKEYNLIRGDVLRYGETLIIPTTKVPKYTVTVASNNSSSSTSSAGTKVTSVTSGLYPQVPQVEGTGTLKAHSFPYGQCTWYVATRRFVPWSGHAKSWLVNAQKYGYEIGTTPAVGAIVVTKENALYGHVAYVEDVTDKYILISEMNYKGWGIVNQRQIPINDYRIVGYIY